MTFPHAQDHCTMFNNQLVEAIGATAVTGRTLVAIRAMAATRLALMARVATLCEVRVFFKVPWATLSACLGLVISASRRALVHHVRED